VENFAGKHAIEGAKNTACVRLENYRQSSERRMTGRVEIHVKEIIRPSRQRSGCDYGSWHITRTKDQPNPIIDRDATLKLEKKLAESTLSGFFRPHLQLFIYPRHLIWQQSTDDLGYLGGFYE
jgi:hypothetical protein